MSSDSFLEVGFGKIAKKYKNLPIASLDVIVGAKRHGLSVISDKIYQENKTKAPKPLLLQLPEDVMRKILEKLNFVAILNLHKTCHDFRNFIQDLQPDSQIFGIRIQVELDRISFLLDFDKIFEEFYDRNHFRISYENQKKSGVRVSWRLKTYFSDKSKLLENSSLLSVFSEDLKVILRHQKTELRYFDLLFHYPNDQEKREYFKILELFQNLNVPLKIRKFEFSGKGEHEVMEILPFLDPRFLKILKIDVGKKNANLELQEIFYLEQWGGVKEAELIGCTTVPWNFESFEKVKISVQVVTTEQILGFKEVLSTSATLAHVTLTFQHYYTENDLVENFGAPSLHTDLYEVNHWKTWRIRVRNSNFAGKRKVIRIERHSDRLQFDIEKLAEN